VASTAARIVRPAVGQFLFPVAKKTLGESAAHDCLDLAAQMSFYFVLSLFPFFFILAALAGWLPSTNLWHNIAQWIAAYLPAGTRQAVFETILDLSRGYTRFLSFGVLATLWTASSGFVSLMESLSAVNGVSETRSFLKKRAIAICATIVGALFFLGSFGLLSFGHWAAILFSDRFGKPGEFHIEWDIARWLATLVLICLGIDLANYFLPNIARPWRWLTPGTLAVALTLLGASVGFNLYLRYFSTYPRIYGALAGFIILLVWIYIANLILLVGVEIDYALEQLRRDGARA
jgi:membrane protein